MRIRKYKIRNEEHEVADLRILKAQLNQQLFMISQPNEKVMDAAWQRWDSIGKPLRSLGAMERAVVKMAGMENSVNVKMDKRAIVVLCGDHGVVREGVTQTDSSVTGSLQIILPQEEQASISWQRRRCRCISGGRGYAR